MKKIFYFVAAIAVLSSCGGGNSSSSASGNDSDSVVTDSILSIEGTWVQPVGDSIKGFTLKEDNSAEAVNMANVKMTKWSQTGDSLFIDATVTLADTVMPEVIKYKIENLKADTLTLIKGDSFTNYVRKR